LIEINLAPGAESARASRRLRVPIKLPKLPALGADTRTLGVGAAGLLGLMAVGFLFWRQGARQEELRAQIQQEVTDSTRFATTIQLVEALRARQDTIQHKIGMIREVDQRRFVWPHLMDEISQALPAFTWLTQISSVEAAEPAPARASRSARADSSARSGRSSGRGRGSREEETPAPAARRRTAGPQFSLQGNAGSTQALTRFMKNLESSPFIREVTLVTSEQVELDGRSLHRFTLEARYELPDSSVIATIPIITME